MGSAAFFFAPLNSRLVSKMAGHRPSMRNVVHLMACLKQVNFLQLCNCVLHIVFDCSRELRSIGPQELRTAQSHQVPAGQQKTATLPESQPAGIFIQGYFRFNIRDLCRGNDPPKVRRARMNCDAVDNLVRASGSLIMANMISGIKILTDPKPSYRLRRTAPPLTGKNLIPHPPTKG
jgi:hypothetical protein